MAEVYKSPSLCNYYCTNDCALGQVYVSPIEEKELPVITLELIAMINKLAKEKERLIEIAVDGHIESDEITDFQTIRSDLKKMSEIIDSMQLWLDNMIAKGEIDKELFD